MKPLQGYPLKLTVIATAFLLGIWGLLAVFGTQYDSAEPFRLVTRQLISFLIALTVLCLAAAVRFDFWRRTVWYWAAVSVLLLLLLPLAGVKINGMSGWFRIGEVHCQPSELGKGIFLLALCVVLIRFREEPKRFFVALAVALCWLLPVVMQPDFGTAAIYFGGFASLYFLSGGRLLLLAGTIAGFGMAAAFFISTHAYAWRRIVGLFDAEADPFGSGWHIRQFGQAIGNGSWTGTGLGEAFHSGGFLPLAYNDSVFAALSETVGFLGSLPIYIGFGVIVWALAALAKRPGVTPEGRCVLVGAAALLAIQALVHICVNLCLIPPTGLTLPLISFGGSSLLGTMLMLGIALSAAGEDAQVCAESGIRK